jgi:hypothetical protein
VSGSRPLRASPMTVAAAIYPLQDLEGVAD